MTTEIKRDPALPSDPKSLLHAEILHAIDDSSRKLKQQYFQRLRNRESTDTVVTDSDMLRRASVLNKDLENIRNIASSYGSTEQNKQHDEMLNVLMVNLDTHLLIMHSIQGHTKAEQLMESVEFDLERIRDLNQPKLALLIIPVLNTLASFHGLLWGCHERAKVTFGQAQRCYENFRAAEEEGDVDLKILDLVDLAEHLRFTSLQATATDSPYEEKIDSLELENIETLSGIADAYYHTHERDSAAMYKLLSLRLQLRLGRYNPDEWAVSLARLSDYYTVSERYPFALHCLACATRMFFDAHTTETDSRTSAKPYIDILRYWVKYAAAFIDFSFSLTAGEQRSIQDKPDPDKFPIECSEYEAWMTCEPATRFDQLVPVFRKAREFLQMAKTFYYFERYPREYLDISLDHCRLWEGISWCERDAARKCKMLKRRADILQELIIDCRTALKLSEFRLHCLNLAMVYSHMCLTKSMQRTWYSMKGEQLRWRKKMETLNNKFFVICVLCLSTYGNSERHYLHEPAVFEILLSLYASIFLNRVLAQQGLNRQGLLNPPLNLALPPAAQLQLRVGISIPQPGFQVRLPWSRFQLRLPRACL